MTMTHIEVAEAARRMWPNKSDAWLAVWLQCLAWYVEHNGDMSGAPGFPSSDVDNDNVGAAK